MVRNAHICVWPSVTRGERHRLYRTYSDGADFIPGLEARFEDVEYRTCAEQLPVTTGAQPRPSRPHGRLCLHLCVKRDMPTRPRSQLAAAAQGV